MGNKKFIDTAIRLAVKSGDYARKRKGSIRNISYKGEINIVTDVDKKCERLIIDGIKKEFPYHSILSEEGYPQPTKGSHRWIIDPLDGTTNFAHGLAIYSVSIALEIDGRVMVGVVYNPETKELFHAEKAKGAFLNKKRIHVSKEKVLKKSLLVTGFAYDLGKAGADNLNFFSKFLRKSQAVRRLGSAALDLSFVACGRFEGFWEMNLHPWDSAAGMLLVEEAGGKVTKFDGSPYTPYDKEILATNSAVHSQMIKILSQN